VADVVKRHPEILKARLTVTHDADRNDVMTLACETASGAGEGLGNVVATSLRDVCKLRGEVRFVTAGTLPNDGKVIEDVRRYD
jgi:phenylacetate-CoA ligase